MAARCTPFEVEELPQCNGTPTVELEHVHSVYERIARSWHGTRYKAWPRVEAFARTLPRGSLVADVGAGNGKNLPACTWTGVGNAAGPSFPIASDLSLELCKICAERSYQVAAADVTRLPFRTGVFDAVLCIAVLHHLSTRARREAACAECCRLLLPGGRAVFYAWAQEQEGTGAASAPAASQAGGEAAAAAGGYSGHRFPTQDVLVPFHVPLHCVDDPAIRELANAQPGRSVVFQRYCHVYCRGELESLFDPLVAAGEVAVEQSWYDCGNWCAVAVRLPPR
ncbi:S-adenosyl-L-methionine-dependent methyltransferase [Pavlovales sp. CCMP2436]|nr:S-adenosyl-L-methionine-dependent methyltransferase [Pavlovales sp. CCMP2436]